MSSRVMRCRCPHCDQTVVDYMNESAPTVCPHCFQMFCASSGVSVPFWVWGIVSILAVHLLITI